MPSPLKPAVLWLLPLLGGGLLAYAWLRAPAVVTQPEPGQSPRTVVSLQLAALREVDAPEPEAGFATVFRFASPENQRQTGPLPRFARLLRSGPYGALINHREALVLAAIEQGGQARVPVDVTSRSGRIYRFVFLLRRVADPACPGCWRTDGVIPPADAASAPET
ncbi:DUF4864 domain-containing protein [Stagnimonas aquatica]|uniref:DUF4864 domain-containing protein n=1 Tax=Stagnimonas aquatica TaxID=2689987 RepID=UPI000F44B3B2|nr:DUF4864 domain-containing protein [Stagnimonas aquatica]